MIEYVTEHFAEEERFMQRYGFPEREEHIKQHKGLYAHGSEVHQELQEKGATIAVITSINHMIFNWRLKHVKQTDVKLGRFLTEIEA